MTYHGRRNAMRAVACVQVRKHSGYVAVRDSKDLGRLRDGEVVYTTLHVPDRDWANFTNDVKAGLPPERLRGMEVTVEDWTEGLIYILSVRNDNDHLSFTQGEWNAFRQDICNGEFDAPAM
jgi:hypothetical protein